MKTRLFLVLGLVLSGCVVDDPARSEGDETEDMAAPTEDAGAGQLDSGGPASDGATNRQPDGGPRDGGRQDGGGPPPTDGGRPPRDMAPVDPDDPEALCAASCAHLRACFESDCPALQGRALDGLCEGLCDADPDLQLDLLDQACPQYVETLTDFIPELANWCSDEPPPEACEAICAYLPECDVPVEGPACAAYCRGLEPEVRDCFTAATQAERCVDVWQCFPDDEPVEPMEPPADERCGQLCQRRARCVTEECSAGSWVPGSGRACFAACMEDPPSSAEVRADGQRLCAEVVAELRADDPALDDRCDADADAACARLCADQVGDCMDPEACLAACPGWNDTNLTCLRFAQERCAVVEVCLESPEDQALCERACGRWSECLAEACPPRILPPHLGVNCAAGCLFEPPTVEEVEAYEALACREVREQIYENNRELAPICEGDPEFHPSPDECVAFCERGLEACIGVGGRAFCLGACATLEREVYECALAAGEDCEAIDRCFAD